MIFFSLSDTLKLLRFLLIEAKQRKSIASFTRRHFISLSKAYRLIDKLKTYLQAIGLTIDHYQIVGEEFRIRYLIALLHKKYGIMIYSITATDIKIINSFVLSPRKPCAANPLDESFLFFHILLMLSWKRQHYCVSLPELPLFSLLKALPIFENLKHYVEKELQDHTKLTFHDGDFDYLYLIYLTSDNSFLTNHWTKEYVQLLEGVIEGHSHYRELISEVEWALGNHFSINPRTLGLVSLFRKSIFGLQTIICFDDYYSCHYHGNPLLFKKLSQQVKQWLSSMGEYHDISPAYLQLLCLHLEHAIESSLHPLQILIIEDNHIIGDIITRFISLNIPSHKVVVSRQNMLLEPNFHSYSDAHLVITSKELIHHIKNHLKLPGHLPVIGISLDNIHAQRDTLVDHILRLHQEHYQVLLSSLFAKPSKSKRRFHSQRRSL